MPLHPPRQQLFEQCVAEHADAMFRVAYRLTGCRDSGSELVQETFLAAWKSLDSLNDPEKLKSWMFSILRNQFHKNLRKKKIKQTILDSDSILAPDPTSVDQQRLDTTEQIQSAVQQLSDEHKMPLLLVTMEGLSVNEAAEILQIPRGTVLSRIHRAKQKLKTMIERQSDAIGFTE